MATSPFKFLDSYTRDDREIFFGREREVEELYFKIYESNLLILYGSSGTGKTSLVQCGLANKFEESDWMPITVRRAENINQSLKRTLQNHALVPLEEKQSLVEQVQSVYLDYFRPLYFFFDQFEELFIFGSEEEIDVFTDNVQQLLDSGMSCKYVFIIRGEYLEYLSRFEDKIPDFFNNRMRVERMTRKNALRVITEPCRLFHVTVTEDFPSKMLAQLENGKATVELTYLQVYLDKLYKKAMTLGGQPVFNEELLQQTGEIGDVLAEFLDEQIAKTSNPERTLTILKSFVSDEGTKKPMSVNEATDFVNGWGQEISHGEVAHALKQLVDLRILKDKDHDEKYELRHDALAAKIFQTFSSGEKELLEVRQFLLNRFSDFQKRNQLLEEADLAYIAPFERKLFLTNELRQFLERSRRIARRKRNRRRNIVLGTGLALILVLSGFTLFSIRQRDAALKQKQIAEQQRQEAINQKELAEKSRELALNASRQAMDAKSFAELQSKIAAEQKKIAQQQANRAQEQTQFATTQQMIALQEKAFADEKNKEAQLQRQKADSAQQEAMRLRMLELSKALALKSLQPASDPQLSALLAWESFRLNEQNGGNPQDAQLYAALHETLKKLNPTAASTIARSKGEIKSMATAGESIIALNSDGSVSTFSIADLSLTKNTPVFPATNLNTGYVSPDGRSFIAAYDNNTLLFYDERKGSLSKPLVGHRGLVRAAAFSNDGSTFVTGGRDSMVIVWNNESAQKKIHFSGRIRSLSMHADNNTVAVGCEDGGMYLLDISSDSKRLIATAAGRIQCGCFNTKKNYLAFGNSAGLINLYNTNGSPLKTIADKTTSVDLLGMNEKQPFMVTASSNKIIHIYNMDDLSSEPVTIKEVPSGITGLALSASGKILVSCADNTLRMFDAVAVHLKDELYAVINRNFTEDEWNTYIGSDVPYQKVKPN